MIHSIGAKYTLYLASKSPRRRELLKNLGIPFEILENDTVEEFPFRENPADFVVRLAEHKAQKPLNSIDSGIVITADTIVYVDGSILEKPKNRDDAARMLFMLQGRTHSVYTGLCVSISPEGNRRSGFEVTDVTFAPMTDCEIEWYLDSGEFHDKAGAYAIQGHASLFIKSINGCYFNVVGLPLNKLYHLLQEIDQLLKKIKTE